MRRSLVSISLRLDRLDLLLFLLIVLLFLVFLLLLLNLVLLIEDRAHFESVIKRVICNGGGGIDVKQLVPQPSDFLMRIVQLHLQPVVLLNHI